ncbi:MAG: hypothetical protein LBF88_05955 [Planctomycetaceae bacterium]|jgi:hypothetical protein|nr:hypothetical protein [Planctomycetaceae bacterium]
MDIKRVRKNAGKLVGKAGKLVGKVVPQPVNDTIIYLSDQLRYIINHLTEENSNNNPNEGKQSGTKKSEQKNSNQSDKIDYSV